MANIAPAQTISISSNVGYTIPILYDQYIGQANIQESLSNVAYPRISSTYSGTLFQAFPQTANVGYSIPILYDQYIGQANVQESLSNVAYPRISTTATTGATTNLAYQLVPYVTYVVSDGAPILLVTTYNVQYWSMA